MVRESCRQNLLRCVDTQHSNSTIVQVECIAINDSLHKDRSARLTVAGKFRAENRQPQYHQDSEDQYRFGRRCHRPDRGFDLFPPMILIQSFWKAVFPQDRSPEPSRYNRIRRYWRLHLQFQISARQESYISCPVSRATSFTSLSPRPDKQTTMTSSGLRLAADFIA